MSEQTLEKTPLPSIEISPELKPRQIHFTSKSTEEIEATPQSLAMSQITETSDDTNDNQTEFHDENKNVSLGKNMKTVDKLKEANDALQNERSKLRKEIETLKIDVGKLKTKVEKNEKELTITKEMYDTKCSELAALNSQLNEEIVNTEVIKQQMNSMQNTIKMKNELISKLEKDAFNYAQSVDTIRRLEEVNRQLTEKAKVRTPNDNSLQMENERLKGMLAATERELAEKMIAYEKCLLDIDEHEKTIFHLNDVLTDSKTARSVEEMRIEIRNYRDRNEELKNEVLQLKEQFLNVNRSSSLNADDEDENAIDEITSRVEKELNYSAQLDSNILKAIESDELNSDNENIDHRFQSGQEIEKIRSQNKILTTNIEQLKQKQDSERQSFSSIREQDADCIDTMTKRLEAALLQEATLSNLLEEERAKTAQLSTKILEHQFERSKLSLSNLSLNDSSNGSPRRSQKNTEFDQEYVKRQNDEIKLLKSQIEREKERALDIEKNLVREKERFEKELRDQQSYGDSIKDELDRVIRENQSLRNELDELQDRLAFIRLFSF